MIQIIFELTLVKEIVALSTKTLHLTSLVNLSKSTLQIVLRHSQVIVNWSSGIPNDILRKEDSQLLPFLEGAIEVQWIFQHIDLIVIRWVLFEFLNQLLGQVWIHRSSWCCLSVHWLCLRENWDLLPLSR